MISANKSVPGQISVFILYSKRFTTWCAYMHAGEYRFAWGTSVPAP